MSENMEESAPKYSRNDLTQRLNRLNLNLHMYSPPLNDSHEDFSPRNVSQDGKTVSEYSLPGNDGNGERYASYASTSSGINSLYSMRRPEAYGKSTIRRITNYSLIRHPKYGKAYSLPFSPRPPEHESGSDLTSSGINAGYSNSNDSEIDESTAMNEDANYSLIRNSVSVKSPTFPGTRISTAIQHTPYEVEEECEDENVLIDSSPKDTDEEIAKENTMENSLSSCGSSIIISEENTEMSKMSDSKECESLEILIDDEVSSIGKAEIANGPMTNKPRQLEYFRYSSSSEDSIDESSSSTSEIEELHYNKSSDKREREEVFTNYCRCKPTGTEKGESIVYTSMLGPKAHYIHSLTMDALGTKKQKKNSKSTSPESSNSSMLTYDSPLHKPGNKKFPSSEL